MGVSLFFICFKPYFYTCYYVFQRITAAKPRSCQLMYYLYIRVAVSVALSCSSSQYRIFKKDTIISARACQLTYYLYVGFCLGWVFPCSSSVLSLIFIYVIMFLANNCGTGAEKVCHFVSTRSFDTLRMTGFLGCARNENLFGAYL